MGMDIVGRDPANKAGEYFRANIWSWRPIHSLMSELYADFLSEELLESMGYNNGDGPADQATCDRIAERFNQWMEHHAAGFTLESEALRMQPDGTLLTAEQAAENPDIETETPYQTNDEHLKEWIEFLHSCGGFEVW